MDWFSRCGDDENAERMLCSSDVTLVVNVDAFSLFMFSSCGDYGNAEYM